MTKILPFNRAQTVQQKKNPQKGEPPTHRGLQLSDLETPKHKNQLLSWKKDAFVGNSCSKNVEEALNSFKDHGVISVGDKPEQTPHTHHSNSKEPIHDSCLLDEVRGSLSFVASQSDDLLRGVQS